MSVGLRDGFGNRLTTGLGVLGLALVLLLPVDVSVAGDGVRKEPGNKAMKMDRGDARSLTREERREFRDRDKMKKEVRKGKERNHQHTKKSSERGSRDWDPMDSKANGKKSDGSKQMKRMDRGSRGWDPMDHQGGANKMMGGKAMERTRGM